MYYTFFSKEYVKNVKKQLSKIKKLQEEKELGEKIICVAENIALNKMIST
jgi:hypothetical protein